MLTNLTRKHSVDGSRNNSGFSEDGCRRKLLPEHIGIATDKRVAFLIAAILKVRLKFPELWAVRRFEFPSSSWTGTIVFRSTWSFSTRFEAVMSNFAYYVEIYTYINTYIYTHISVSFFARLEATALLTGYYKLRCVLITGTIFSLCRTSQSFTLSFAFAPSKCNISSVL